MARTNSRAFMEQNFPELRQYKQSTSRRFEHSPEKQHYYDDWWFKFDLSDLDKHEFIIFIGAMDYVDKDFKVLKVPSSFIKERLDFVSMTDKGWINVYLHFESLRDLRHPNGLNFAQFAVN